MPDRLSITVRSDFASLMLAIAGTLDSTTAPRLRRALAAVAGRSHVLLDTGDVVLIDSHALWVLVSESSRFSNAGGSLRICNPSHEVRRMLKKNHADSMLIDFEAEHEPSPPWPMRAPNAFAR